MWKDGKYSGQGKYVWKDGQLFDGSFQDGFAKGHNEIVFHSFG